MPDTEQEWKRYTEKELVTLRPVLLRLGYALAQEQPHLSGERFLMQAVTTESGKKLILLGTRTEDGVNVVIKATSDGAGKRELKHEQTCRRVLNQLRFSYNTFQTPEELYFGHVGSHVISIQRFIEQDGPFLARPIAEQFSYALAAFKAQESVHAATYEQARLIEHTFGSMNVEEYLDSFVKFRHDILVDPFKAANVPETFEIAETFLRQNKETIEQYTGFLTHTDFVPHNFRIKNDTLYLLDYSSLRFGNKHEGWARFLNFMTLYNPALADALTSYVRDNRAEEEALSLKLMRVYRLGEILAYYTNTLKKSDGNLLLLNQARREFWLRVLESVLEDGPLDEAVRKDYVQTRDSLRSTEEHERQEGLH